ncbi:MAG: DUF4126 family protein [Edaphobacter sp.]|uniref:DUF4126 family protein n=1 Tax=Edaphobacter sp. TaxID=1934404 RepID=UPI0023A13A0A|nr:DUF4126 family protein [Edaphobacter sp.]MDE1176851.1 DUF4126 family protein [Edaphobacter sp.]
MLFSVLVLCFLIGCVAGLRSMMAPAIVAAAAYLRWIHLEGTSLAWMDTRLALSLWTLCAIGELIVDKLPQTPARTMPVGLVARAITGGLCGAALAMSAGKGAQVGALLGAAGGIGGAFVGYYVRRGLVLQTKLPDFVVAVVEDLLAISGGLFICSHM